MLWIEKQKFDLLLLDLMLPGLEGQQVLQKIRKQENMVPIIALTAKDEVATKVEILKLGADDYITKPFNNEELLARIEAILRRNKIMKQETRLVFKDLTLNTNTFEVKVSGQEVNLTKREYLILELLMTNPNKVFTKHNIFESVWNEEYVGEDNSVNVHISNIRQKLANKNKEIDYIKTVWGIGFKMNG